MAAPAMLFAPGDFPGRNTLGAAFFWSNYYQINSLVKNKNIVTVIGSFLSSELSPNL
ncbi:MAG: hypothetical protein WC851_00395 [Candidatus Shapirobacteria bacterium]|jgi:hypothetical protein